MQFHVVVDDVPRVRLRALVRAGFAGSPTWWPPVDVVAVAHAASSVSLGERLGKQDLIHIQ
ncbi:hypothetical protein, partial [Xanthomonas translucens]|uniref:hypothetical protein n=1 Tax=Xanthomonas campestris pv. translucens TaxID=343 RepID=UPI001E3EE8DE